MEHTESHFPEPRKGNYRFENSYAGLIGTDVIDIHAILLSQLVDLLHHVALYIILNTPYHFAGRTFILGLFLMFCMNSIR
jgi:hypothetical protein